jgi:[acyl-carrier-protein] S-malonyltransferase
MEPAVPGLRDALGTVSWSDPSFPVYSNVDAQPNRSASAARELLMRQVTAPVRWSEVVRALVGDFPGAEFVELGPGTVLAGLIKRIAPGTVTHACGTADDAQRLLARVA